MVVILQSNLKTPGFLISSKIMNSRLMIGGAVNTPPLLPEDTLPILIESGLIRLEHSPSANRLFSHDNSRLRRIEYLKHQSSAFTLIHLSDEQGNDARTFYSIIPRYTPIWRNFYYSELNQLHHNISSFPIGPRDLFLQSSGDSSIFGKSSLRMYPWAFMGTLWPSGSRKQAVSHFLRLLPQGFHFGSSSFGLGLPLDEYRQYLLNSTFALAPEGDRHLDTFRLWESLHCGCIPLLVNYKSQAPSLLPYSSPIPVFDSWKDACRFAAISLSDPNYINSLQSKIIQWWTRYQHILADQITSVH